MEFIVKLFCISRAIVFCFGIIIGISIDSDCFGLLVFVVEVKLDNSEWDNESIDSCDSWYWWWWKWFLVDGRIKSETKVAGKSPFCPVLVNIPCHHPLSLSASNTP